MLSQLAFLLIGAVLISLGVLAEALAERLRGGKLTRERAEIARLLADLKAAREAMRPVRESRRAAAAAAMPAGTPLAPAETPMGKDAVLVLTRMGYSKPDATAAVNGVDSSQASTLEAWSRASLRLLMKRTDATA